MIFHEINYIDREGKTTGGFLIPSSVPTEYVQKLVAKLQRILSSELQCVLSSEEPDHEEAEAESGE